LPVSLLEVFYSKQLFKKQLFVDTVFTSTYSVTIYYHTAILYFCAIHQTYLLATPFFEIKGVSE